VVALGLALAWAFGGDNETAAVGERGPDFTVELLDGGEFTLSRHLEDSGQPLIINLWASWCAPCRDEIPALSAFADNHPELTVIGVAVEDRPDDSRALAADLGPTYPLALGTAEFEDAYPNFGLPVTYFLDEEGVVTEVYNGILTVEKLEERLQ
jgi:thiol-disulfide isomerase/thioredoxin